METDKTLENECLKTKEFLIDILTDMECLKNLIYNGSDVAAYRNLQKISDKVRDQIRNRMKEDTNDK